MPSVTSLTGRIATNIPSMQAYDSLQKASNQIALSQLRLSTGRRINSAADDVSGFITSRSLLARNSSLQSAIVSTGEAKNVTAIVQDSLDNVINLLTEIRYSATLASSGSIGTSEKVTLGRAAFRMAQQIETVVESTVFSGQQLLSGSYTASWILGYNGENEALDVYLNLDKSNQDFNINSQNFSLNALTPVDNQNIIFAGITNLDLRQLDSVSIDDLGIFSDEQIDNFIVSLSEAINNVAKVGSYVGGIERRLNSQNDILLSQITNYSNAISRIDDADTAEEQLKLTRNQFLQQTSIIGISQSNVSTINYFRLFV
jgi:flagellin